MVQMASTTSERRTGKARFCAARQLRAWRALVMPSADDLLIARQSVFNLRLGESSDSDRELGRGESLFVGHEFPELVVNQRVQFSSHSTSWFLDKQPLLYQFCQLSPH